MGLSNGHFTSNIDSSVITTKGDLIVGGATAGSAQRLGVGNNNQIIVADSTTATGLKWTESNTGSKNYFQYNSFENNATTGWSLGAVTAPVSPTFFPTGVPTFGSGASGNLSLSTVGGSPIAGTYALSYASSAPTTGGNFVASDVFTIDAEDQAKILAFKFSYKAQTNPTNANWSGTTANSFGVAIYDVTNSAWIQPAGCFNLVQSSGVGQASGTFQTSSNGTSYRLVVYNANATSGAVTVYFDSFFVGPQVTAAGAAVSDWTSYTPTGGWTGSVTYNGKWRRVGDSMEVIAQVSCSGAPTGTNPTINLPSGFTIDTAKLATNTSREPLGLAVFVDFGVETYRGAVFYNNTTSVMPAVYNASATYAVDNIPSTTVPFTFGASDLITVEFKVPITGWSSNTVMSSDTDTRVVAAKFQGIPTGSIGAAPNVITFPTKVIDTHGAYSSGVYTVPVSGIYDVRAMVEITGTETLDQVTTVAVTVNGSTAGYIDSKRVAGATASNVVTGSTLISVNAGDLVRITCYTTIGSPSYNSVETNPSFSISRLSGPATIAATDSVNANYTATPPTGTLNGSFNITTYGTKIKDSHNAYSGGTYTVPVSGAYDISASVETSGTFTTNGSSLISVFVDGVEKYRARLYTTYTAGTTYLFPSINVRSVPLLAGQAVTIRSSCDATSPAFGSGPANFFSITRTGN